MEQQNTTRCKAPSWYDTDPDQLEVTAILMGLKRDLSLNGCMSLGKDGVLRSLTADRDVVDAVGLNPRQITALLRRMPTGSGIEVDFEGADGTKIPKETWFEPDKSLLPPPLSEEAREEAREKLRKAMEENPEMFQRKREELRQAWEKSG